LSSSKRSVENCSCQVPSFKSINQLCVHERKKKAMSGDHLLFAGNRMSFDLGSTRSSTVSVRQQIQTFESKRVNSMSPRNSNFGSQSLYDHHRQVPSMKMDREVLKMSEMKAQELTIDDDDEAPAIPLNTMRTSVRKSTNLNSHSTSSYFPVRNSHQYQPRNDNFSDGNTTNSSLSSSFLNLKTVNSDLVLAMTNQPVSPPSFPKNIPPPYTNFLDVQPLINEKDFEVDISTYELAQEPLSPMTSYQNKTVPSYMRQEVVMAPLIPSVPSSPLWEYPTKEKLIKNNNISSFTVITDDTETSESTVSSLGQEGPEEAAEKLGEKKKSLRWKAELVEVLSVPHKSSYEISREYERKQEELIKQKMQKNKRNSGSQQKKSFWMRFVCGANQE
jgi:hypothetical protein